MVGELPEVSLASTGQLADDDDAVEPGPVRSVASTDWVAVAIADTSPAPELTTNKVLPSGVIAMLNGLLRTLIGGPAPAVFVAVLTGTTVPEPPSSPAA